MKTPISFSFSLDKTGNTLFLSHVRQESWEKQRIIKRARAEEGQEDSRNKSTNSRNPCYPLLAWQYCSAQNVKNGQATLRRVGFRRLSSPFLTGWPTAQPNSLHVKTDSTFLPRQKRSSGICLCSAHTQRRNSSRTEIGQKRDSLFSCSIDGGFTELRAAHATTTALSSSAAVLLHFCHRLSKEWSVRVQKVAPRA